MTQPALEKFQLVEWWALATVLQRRIKAYRASKHPNSESVFNAAHDLLGQIEQDVKELQMLQKEPKK